MVLLPGQQHKDPAAVTRAAKIAILELCPLEAWGGQNSAFMDLGSGPGYTRGSLHSIDLLSCIIDPQAGRCGTGTWDSTRYSTVVYSTRRAVRCSARTPSGGRRGAASLGWLLTLERDPNRCEPRRLLAGESGWSVHGPGCPSPLELQEKTDRRAVLKSEYLSLALSDLKAPPPLVHEILPGQHFVYRTNHSLYAICTALSSWRPRCTNPQERRRCIDASPDSRSLSPLFLSVPPDTGSPISPQLSSAQPGRLQATCKDRPGVAMINVHTRPEGRMSPSEAGEKQGDPVVLLGWMTSGKGARAVVLFSLRSLCPSEILCMVLQSLWQFHLQTFRDLAYRTRRVVGMPLHRIM